MERQFLFQVKIIVKEENEAPNLFFEIFKFWIFYIADGWTYKL